jgi:hypothetical protein
MRDRGFNIMSKDKFAIQIYPHALLALFEIRHCKPIIIAIGMVLLVFVIGDICWTAEAETTIISALPAAISQAAVIHSVPHVSLQPVPHKLERDAYYRYCMRCHGAGKMRQFPPNHSKYDVKSCLDCHSLSSTPKVGDSDAEQAMGGKLKLIPHSTKEDMYRDCATCHGGGQMKPFPPNHSKYAVKSCLGCHKLGPTPKVGDSIVGNAMGEKPKPIPHSIEEDTYKDCTKCHGAGQVKPFPANHLHYDAEICTACHRQDSRGSRK